MLVAERCLSQPVWVPAIWMSLRVTVATAVIVIVRGSNGVRGCSEQAVRIRCSCSDLRLRDTVIRIFIFS